MSTSSPEEILSTVDHVELDPRYPSVPFVAIPTRAVRAYLNAQTQHNPQQDRHLLATALQDNATRNARVLLRAAQAQMASGMTRPFQLVSTFSGDSTSGRGVEVAVLPDRYFDSLVSHVGDQRAADIHLRSAVGTTIRNVLEQAFTVDTSTFDIAPGRGL